MGTEEVRQRGKLDPLGLGSAPPTPNLGPEVPRAAPRPGAPIEGQMDHTPALQLRPLGRGLGQSWCHGALSGQRLSRLREDSPAFHLNPRLHVKPRFSHRRRRVREESPAHSPWRCGCCCRASLIPLLHVLSERKAASGGARATGCGAPAWAAAQLCSATLSLPGALSSSPAPLAPPLAPEGRHRPPLAGARKKPSGARGISSFPTGMVNGLFGGCPDTPSPRLSVSTLPTTDRRT